MYASDKHQTVLPVQEHFMARALVFMYHLSFANAYPSPYPSPSTDTPTRGRSDAETHTHTHIRTYLWFVTLLASFARVEAAFFPFARRPTRT